MKPKYIQFNCVESKALDLRQAKAILKHKPDIVILEYPNNKKTPDWEFNKYPALKKPKKLVSDRIKEFPPEVLKVHPWAKADTIMWRNIAGLWEKGHQIFVYSVDAPNELTKEWLDVWRGAYPCIQKNWVWWVQIYLREKMMAQHIKWILKNYKEKEDPTVLVFLQNFHWQHVKFLLTSPAKKEIWAYYFGRFSEIDKKTIGARIKSLNKVFYKYWKSVSDF